MIVLINQNAYEQIIKNLNYKVNLILKEKVTSTNELLKQQADSLDHFTVMIANEQTNGKGRMGRNFYSPNQSGIYMSILLKQNLNIKDSLLLTVKCAVAVAKAIETLSDKQPKIKWVNDIYINDKKVCGILTEASMSPKNNNLDYAVVGIGVNITPIKNPPDDIKNIAGSVFDHQKNIKNQMIAQIINEFISLLDCDVLDSYRNYSMLTGKRVEVINPQGNYIATVVGIADDFSLIVDNQEGERHFLNSGEVRVKAYE